MNGNCDFIGVVRGTRAAYKEQARCAVKRVAEILDRLKDVGVYDKTFVVISSDHGIGLPPPQFVNDRQTPMGTVARIAGNAMALLVVKPLNSDGPVRTSQCADHHHRHPCDHSGRRWRRRRICRASRR